VGPVIRSQSVAPSDVLDNARHEGRAADTWCRYMPCR